MSYFTNSNAAISRGRTLGRNQIICRYYVRGMCRFGEFCHYSHDLSGGQAQPEVVPADRPRPSTSFSIKNWVNAPEFVPRQRYVPIAQEQSEKDMDMNIEMDMEMDIGMDIGMDMEMDIEKDMEMDIEMNREMDMKLDMEMDMDTDNEMEITLGFSPIYSWVEAIKPDCTLTEPTSWDDVCPYEMSPCLWGKHCPYRVHLELCEMCDEYCLHPTDLDQRREHNRECLEDHEKAMELSFAIARSKDKTCGICFETIMEKKGAKKRFGILPNCNHIFCLDCIRTWRQAKNFNHAITRACPECRVCSNFVCPSTFWVETKEDKDKLLNDYRLALGAKDCKYFKKGDGTCPFGNKCFYKHALPNGDHIDVGLPKGNVKKGIQEIIETLRWLRMFASESSDYSDEE